MSKKSERVLKIYALLKSQPISIERLRFWAEQNNITISERTFYRDLEVLESSMLLPNERISVSIGEKNKKIWKIEYTGNDKLTEFDINTYLLTQNFLPKPIVEARSESLDRILDVFYRTYSKSRFQDFASYSHHQIKSTQFGEFGSSPHYAKTLEDALWSIQNCREINILKTDFDITSISKSVIFPIQFLPLKLLYHRGVVHLAGYDKASEKLIILALAQITQYQLTNIPFRKGVLLKKIEKELNNRFGITENINNELYDIELEFSEALGYFIKENYWHPTQKFEQKENGNFRMRLHCGISRELVGWIFMWMTNVRVINPPILKEMLLNKYREVLNDYDQEKPLVSNNSFRAE